MDYLHKGPVMRKVIPCYGVIMMNTWRPQIKKIQDYIHGKWNKIVLVST